MYCTGHTKHNIESWGTRGTAAQHSGKHPTDVANNTFLYPVTQGSSVFQIILRRLAVRQVNPEKEGIWKEAVVTYTISQHTPGQNEENYNYSNSYLQPIALSVNNVFHTTCTRWLKYDRD